MIDEKKLIEVLERNFGGIGGASVLKQLIEAQPKISLENKTSDWIPVEEALPNEDGNYLVSGVWGSGKKTVGDCEFSVSDGYFDVCWNFNVLAWQPLPKPYKSEE